MAYAVEACAGLGWTFYPPLATAAIVLVAYGITLLIVSLAIMGISTTLTSVNFIATILCRSIMMLFIHVGAFVRSYVVTSVLLVIALPALALALLMLISDIYFNTGFFDAGYGGDVIMYEHLFWFFGHP